MPEGTGDAIQNLPWDGEQGIGEAGERKLAGIAEGPGDVSGGAADAVCLTSPDGEFHGIRDRAGLRAGAGNVAVCARDIGFAGGSGA